VFRVFRGSKCLEIFGKVLNTLSLTSSARSLQPWVFIPKILDARACLEDYVDGFHHREIHPHSGFMGSNSCPPERSRR
ncbi:MAG TPA: hypothetical protein PLB18_11500, partial [Acidobacteriota bacterium]|nr:hypothetical protein [Acidobacteriota bacterium]